MKASKLIALFLCFVLIFGLIIGCSDTDAEDPENGDEPSPGNGSGSGSVNSDIHDHSRIDFESAVNAFPLETVMIKSGDLTITWAELYFFLFNAISETTYYFGNFNWSDQFIYEGTFADHVLEGTLEASLDILAYNYGINSSGITLSADLLKAFNDEQDEILELNGGREAVEEILFNNAGFINYDLYVEFNKLRLLVDMLVNHIYGEAAENLPDEKVAAFAEVNDFLMAMHILTSKTGEFDDPLGEAEKILSILNEQSGSDDFTQFFHELMHEVSEDTGGLMSYPDGYLFVKEDMVSEFSLATIGLEIGQLSGIVETDYGYHIILRIPIDYDIVPSGFSRQGMMITLRQLAAHDDFEGQKAQWLDLLDVEFTPEFNSIDLSEIFKWVDDECD